MQIIHFAVALLAPSLASFLLNPPSPRESSRNLPTACCRHVVYSCLAERHDGASTSAYSLLLLLCIYASEALSYYEALNEHECDQGGLDPEASAR